MAITLTEVLDGSGNVVAAGNTYASIAYADARFVGRASVATWDAASDDTQARAMLDAMDLLRGRKWIGERLDFTQPEDWPRVAIRPIERRTRQRIVTGYETLTGASAGLYDHTGKFWATTVIPTPVKNAQCDLAYQFVVSGNSPSSSGVSDYSKIVVNVGDVELTRTLDNGGATIPQVILQALRPLMMMGTPTSR